MCACATCGSKSWMLQGQQLLIFLLPNSPAKLLCPPPVPLGFPALAVSYRNSLSFSSAPWRPNTASPPPAGRALWWTASIASGKRALQAANARHVPTAAVPPYPYEASFADRSRWSACHTKSGPLQNDSPRNVRGRKVRPPPGTFAAVCWGPSVAPHMVRPCCRWSPVLKAFLRPYLGCRRSVVQFETLLASTGHRALLPALPTLYSHRALLPALRGSIFTLANIYHKTMHNPNLSTLNYLFLYHETNCDMNHPSISLVDGICKIP